MSSRAWSRIVPLLFVAACGTADRSTGPHPDEHPFHSGGLTGATRGRVGPAETTNSDDVVVTGLAGTFTRLTVSAGGNGTEQAYVYFASYDSTDHSRIWRIGTSGTGLRQLTNQSFNQENPSVSNAGDKLVYINATELIDRSSIHNDLWLWSPEAGSHFLASERNVLSTPAWVTGDTAIIYPSFFRSMTPESDSLVFGIYRRNVTTAAIDTLTQGPVDWPTTTVRSGIPTVIFARDSDLYQLNLNTLETRLYLDLPGFELSQPQVSPDGRKILFWSLLPDLSSLFESPIDHPEAMREVTSFGVGGFRGLVAARWLPDASAIVILAKDSTLTPPTHQLFLMDTLGQQLGRITSMPRGVSSYFSVGRFTSTAPQQLIGEGGLLGSEASGIIFGEAQGGRITSVVAFTAATPRSVRITEETGLNSGAPVLTYTLRADRITRLSYIGEPPIDTAITVVDSTTASATGAVIGFDAVTGRVALVLPFSGAGRQGAAIQR